jgi:hypothetical protein
MKTIGLMLADLRTSATGLPARTAADLAGQPVLRRSVGRALAARSLARVAILAPADQHDRIRQLLGELAGNPRLLLAELSADRRASFGWFDPGRVRLARRWSLAGWRGGIGGACWFDELLAPVAMNDLARREGADAVALLSPDAPLLDAALVDATVAQCDFVRELYRLAISQAPPGLGTVCLRVEMLAELANTGQSVGRALAYDPATPQPDLATKDGCVKLPIETIACPHRFLADTARGFALLEQVIARCGDAPTVEQSAAAANANFEDQPERWPAEIDFELTTHRPIADSLRPGCPLVPTRGPVDDRTVARACESLRAMAADDVVVTLGGFGDPLMHPNVLAIAEQLKSAGVLAVAVRTSGVGMDNECVGRLLDSAVDVVCVELDAATREGYRLLKSADCFDAVTAGMTKLLEDRQRRNQPGPLLVAELTKCVATLAEMEPLFARWRLADEAHLAGLHEYGGQFRSPAGPGWPTCSPRRGPCWRINRRMTVLADGTVPICDLDFKAAPAIGRIQDTLLADIWTGPAFARLRRDHHELRLADWPICQACDQWNRP